MIPLEDHEGQVDLMAMYAGQSAGLVDNILPAAEILGRILSDAASCLSRWAELEPREADDAP